MLLVHSRSNISASDTVSVPINVDGELRPAIHLVENNGNVSILRDRKRPDLSYEATHIQRSSAELILPNEYPTSRNGNARQDRHDNQHHQNFH